MSCNICSYHGFLFSSVLINSSGYHSILRENSWWTLACFVHLIDANYNSLFLKNNGDDDKAKQPAISVPIPECQEWMIPE